MENKLEQLLNSLIEKGRKPFGKNNRGNVTIDKTIETKSPFFDFDYHNMSVSTRELISKESGLWQFVCENGMTTLQIEYNNRKPPERGIRYHWNKHSNVMQEDERLTKERKRNENYEFRLIESALKDESELESFILDNIKVDAV